MGEDRSSRNTVLVTWETTKSSTDKSERLLNVWKDTREPTQFSTKVSARLTGVYKVSRKAQKTSREEN